MYNLSCVYRLIRSSTKVVTGGDTVYCRIMQLSPGVVYSAPPVMTSKLHLVSIRGGAVYSGRGVTLRKLPYPSYAIHNPGPTQQATQPCTQRHCRLPKWCLITADLTLRFYFPCQTRLSSVGRWKVYCQRERAQQHMHRRGKGK